MVKVIAGTFLQFWATMREIDAAGWARELDAMRAVKIRLLVVQWVQSDGQHLFEPPDPFPLLLDLAYQRGMRVIFGLRHDSRWWRECMDAEYLRNEEEASVALARQVHQRYGRHPAFAGFYIPYELWDGAFTEAQIGRFRDLLRRIGGACRQLAPGKPVLLAPFFTAALSPARFEALWLQLLQHRSVDVVALQDGVGARGWDEQIEQRLPPYFAAMRRACQRRRVALWSDLECFRLANNDPDRPRFVPASAERILRQLKTVSPYVERVITFDFFHYMSPYRGEAQKALYEGYQRALERL